MASQEIAVQTTDAYASKTVEIGNFDPAKYNVLIRGRTVVQTNPFLKPVVREITLDHAADWYPITTRKQGDDWVPTELGISAVGLANLASQGGLIDIPQASGRVDDGRDPKVVTYRATGAVRMPDGEWQVKTRECTVKLVQLEKEIRAQKTAKAKQSEKGQYAWTAEKLEAEIAKELLLKEKFMERLAETGAKNRVIRAAFGLQTKYTPDEARRPFVLAAVVPDMSQPELRARMLDQATSAIGAVFGPVSGQAGAAPRLLTAGPTEADVASSDLEGGDLQADEIEGASTLDADDPAFAEAPEGATRSPRYVKVAPDGTQTVTRATAPEEPSWISEATAPKAPAKPDFATSLRDSAAAVNDPEALAEQDDLDRLAEVFAGWDRNVIVAGLKAVWPDTALQNLAGGQAQAIDKVHGSMGHDAFEDAWRKVGDKAAVAA